MLFMLSPNGTLGTLGALGALDGLRGASPGGGVPAIAHFSRLLRMASWKKCSKKCERAPPYLIE